MLELALAYNFITPYTAFLAVPESELGNMKQTLDNARAEKQQIIDKHPDVAALSPGMAPKAADDRDGDYDEQASPIASTSEIQRKGCAGCATSGPDGGLLLVAFALLLRTPRRGRRSR